MSRRVLAVFGGQYGSEGKGVVVASLAGEYAVHVRVGGPNAGHSFSMAGRVWKMQSIPCGWINPNATLVIGRGALVSLEQLDREIREIETVDPSIRDRVWVDNESIIIDPQLHAEGHTDGDLHRRIGSTGEGIGAARVARMMRDPELSYTFGAAMNPHTMHHRAEYVHLARLGRDDTAGYLNRQAKGGTSILLEGTQGAGLSLTHGPWPYTTSADVGVAAMCADTGLAPSRVGRRLMVVRTFPIRVAGNSGPLLGETTWDQMTARIGKPVVERTTVTKKIRRIGLWDEALVRSAVIRNDPTSTALMFVDYLSPPDEGKTKYDDLGTSTKSFVQYIESAFGTPVSIVGTGGEGWQTIHRSRP
jgi:adenylosuccinate synthase